MKEVLAFFSQVDILIGWEPVRLIGSGSNGRVYHIRNTITGDESALKWIHIDRSEDSVLSRFSFEKAQAMLTGEIAMMKELNTTIGIVKIQESRCISPDGSSMDAFIRMELLEPLLSRLNAQTVTVAQTEKLVMDVSIALDACHSREIIHGDIKPENILCGKDGFKLGDFGVAQDMLHRNRRNPQGTQYFQPPEYRNGDPASVQGDLYSFGMMLYVIFNNGMLPFQTEPGRQEEQQAWQHCCDWMKRPDSSYPPPKSATAEIAAVITKAIKVDPALRYQTAKELADAFQAAAASLTGTQKAMILPYNVTRKEPSPEENIYLSTGRTTYGSDTRASATATNIEKQKNEFDNTVGFAIPEAETITEEKPSAAQPISEQPPKKLPVPLLVGGIMAVVAVIILAVLLMRKQPALQYQIKPAMFGAELTLQNVPDDTPIKATVRASGTERGTAFTTSGKLLSVVNLAPATTYEIDIEADGLHDTISFATTPAADGVFQPVSQRCYTCKSLLLKQRSAEELEDKNLLDEVSGQIITLRNAPLSEQNMAILFSCLAHTEQTEFTQQSEMYTVLRIPNKAVLVQPKTIDPLVLTDNYFRCMEDISGLLDAYYTLYGSHPEEQIRIELYWQNELIGSMELMMNTTGGA